MNEEQILNRATEYGFKPKRKAEIGELLRIGHF
jgi:hypothetical protein